MSQLVAMFCDLDDFCKHFEPIYTHRLLQSGKRRRTLAFHACPQTDIQRILWLIDRRHHMAYGQPPNPEVHDALSARQ